MPDDDPDPFDPDRDRGILTSRDRKLLLGRSEIAPRSQAERNARADIRERVRDAILDFSILLHHLEDRDREQAFVPDSESEGADQIRTGIVHALGFLYLVDPENFAAMVEAGIEAALREQGWLADATVTIDINRRMSRDELFEAVAESGEVYADEMDLLLDHPEVDPLSIMRLKQHYREKRDSGLPEGIDDPETAIQMLDLPGRGAVREQQRKAVETAYEYLREEGAVSREELMERIYPIYPGGYDNPEAWYFNCIHGALSELPDVQIFTRAPDGKNIRHQPNDTPTEFDE